MSTPNIDSIIKPLIKHFNFLPIDTRSEAIYVITKLVEDNKSEYVLSFFTACDVLKQCQIHLKKKKIKLNKGVIFYDFNELIQIITTTEQIFRSKSLIKSTKINNGFIRTLMLLSINKMINDKISDSSHTFQLNIN